MIEQDDLARKIVTKMMQNDLFSQWMDVKIIEVSEGYSKIEMNLRNEMVNGFNVISSLLVVVPFFLA